MKYMYNDTIPLAWLTLEAVRRAAAKGIELDASPLGHVNERTAPGHYLHLFLSHDWMPLAQIIVRERYIPTPGTYDDLLPGFEKIAVVSMIADDPQLYGKFVSINYRFDEEAFERDIQGPLR